MRILASVLFSALVVGFGLGGAAARAQTQAAPPQTTVQAPEGSVQSDDRDRNGAGNVRIERDWKAQGGDSDRTGSIKPEEGHETIGRDWRAHPEKPER